MPPEPHEQANFTPQQVQVAEQRLAELEANLVVGNPRKDGIPAIDNPTYVSAQEAEQFMEDDDGIFGIVYQGTAKAFPQKILVWHEIVNDQIAGDRISVTYCPLTGTVMGFRGASLVDGHALTFGTSGKLVNSNLVMYDRQTDSEWPQMLGAAINGPNKGNQLEQFPTIWTTWGRWKARYPNTEVLSLQTGFARDYGYDPYGSYRQTNTYYQQDGPFFPVLASSDALTPKKVVIGIKFEDGSMAAIPKDELRANGILSGTHNDQAFVAIYNRQLEDALVYSRTVGNETLNFRLENQTVDEETGSEWNIWGQATSGELQGTQLRYLDSFDAMWFAWYAYFPDTTIINP